MFKYSLFFLLFFVSHVFAQKVDSVKMLTEQATLLLKEDKADSARAYLNRAALKAKAQKRWNDYLGIAVKTGQLLSQQRNYKEQLELLVNVFDAHDYKTDLPNYYDFFEMYVLAHDQMSLYQQVIPLYEKLIRLTKDFHGEDHQNLINIHGRLGLVYGNVGLMDEAKEHIREALKRAKARFGDYHMLVANIYNSLGLVYKHTGNLESALTYYNRAEDIIKKIDPDNHSTLAIMNNNIAHVYIQKEDYEPALRFTNQSHELDQREANPSLYATRGIVLMELGKHEQALTMFKKSVNIRAKRLGLEHPTQSLPHTMVGKAFTKLGKYDSALHYLTTAIKLDTTGKSASEDYANAVEALGDLYKIRQKYDLALESYDDGISFYLPKNTDEMFGKLIPDNKKIVYDLYRKKAEVLEKWYEDSLREDLLVKSFENYYQAIHSLNLYRHSIYDSEFKTFYASQNKNIFTGALRTSFQLYDLTKKQEYVEYAYEIMELNKSFSLAEELTSRENLQTNVPDSVVSELKEVTLLLSYNEQQLKEAKDSVLLKSYQEEVFELTVRLNKLNDYVKLTYPQYYEFKSNSKIVPVNELQAFLTDDDLFIEYYQTSEALYVIGITQNQIQLQKLTDLAALDEYIPNLRSLDQMVFADASYAVYDSYLQPVLRHFDGYDNLIVVTDKQLGYVPFEILISKKPSRGEGFNQFAYLIKDHNISYHYSARLLKFFSSDVHEGENDLIAYAPEFKQEPYNPLLATRSTSDSVLLKQLPALPMAEYEASQIASVFNGSAKVGDMATEYDFKQNAPGYDIIHLATHAIVDQKDPLHSRLIFSPDQDSGEDGLLHTYELYNMNIDADLVSLSACNTGIGKYYSGEGVISLARGFMYAGVPNIMMSLWSVPDKSTATIMESFYMYLRKGYSKSGALRQAKLDYLSAADANTAAPYFWSGFVFIGNPEKEPNTNNYALAGTGALIILAGMLFIYVRRKKRR